MDSKKGFEIQFNWIFVLIVGAAILLFFTVIIYKQRGISQSSTKITLLKEIEKIISGASASTDTTNIITFPNANIKIDCNKISIDEVSKQYQNLILFAPSQIKGSELMTLTLAFNTPYRSTNLLYMTNKQIRYIFIGDNDFAKETIKAFPSELKKEIYSLYDSTKIKYFNDNKVRLVFANSLFSASSAAPSSLAKMQDSDISAVKISGDIEKGQLEFYERKGNSWTSKGTSVYIGKCSLLGAVYSDDLLKYECNMKNVFSRLSLVTSVYEDRTSELKNYFEQTATRRQVCSDIYQTATAKLNSIKTSSTDFTQSSIDIIAAAAKDLSQQNKEAQKFSCPLIY